jgi:hypothetical protein
MEHLFFFYRNSVGSYDGFARSSNRNPWLVCALVPVIVFLRHTLYSSFARDHASTPLSKIACSGTQAEHHHAYGISKGITRKRDSVKAGSWPSTVRDPAQVLKFIALDPVPNPSTPFWLRLYILQPMAHHFPDTPLLLLSTYLCFSRPPEW